jgi:6-pyruvoyl-tetrahydropterin synthase related domain
MEIGESHSLNQNEIKEAAPQRVHQKPQFSGRPNSLFPVSFLIIAAIGLVIVAPFAWLGIPSGHDIEFHLNSWMEVLTQWKHFILYPHWAALAHYGYGEPRFIFYPPASWILGAALGAVLPWVLTPAAYCWIALTLSGCSMFLLARAWLPRRDAIFAAALYAANPYYIVIVYWRSAFAELLAGALLPLLLLYALRARENRRGSVVTLSVIIAAAWLTNAPSAVMAIYSLALLAAVMAILDRAPRILLVVSTAILIGTALAALYVLPAAYEQRWVDIAQAISLGSRPQDNFLFTKIADSDHNIFNRLISLVAVAEIIATGIAIAFACRSHRKRLSAFWPLASWAIAAAVLMFPVSLALWNHLPELRFMQFPWRWLLCLDVALALFVTLAWQRWLPRFLLCAALLCVLIFVWHRIQPPWWDHAPDIAELLDDQQDGPGYEGTDEYTPIATDAAQVKQDAPLAVYVGPGSAQIQIQDWAAQAKLLTGTATQPGELVLKLFNYPAWRAEVNGRVVQTQTRNVTGQMMIPISSGENSIRIVFIGTWDQTAGDVVSALTAICVLGFVLFRRRRDAIASSP